MATRKTATELSRIIAELQAERQEHVDAIAGIDGMFDEFGITAEPTSRRGRPRKAKNGRRKKAGKRKVAKKKVAKNGRPKGGKKTGKMATKKKAGRQKFSKTANDFVLDLMKSGKTMTTAQINAKWRQVQRPGNADNTLSLLAKDGKVKREKIEGTRGSRYSVV